ncbi:MAG: AraC family transcriptional regulator [Muribaculaceae bacterium]|nr:AraC family transcriptional regulator [Muribaculaceae bacterium]
MESNDKRQVPGTSEDSPDPISDGNQLSDADKAFIARAVEAVEKNLNTPGYSVASLSRDLCMDRTGLYRKLTALLDRSPSLFIRDIRLRNAARLLEEGKLSITEISELTGFSSTSYMSKCFQERYGCRPSDYAEKNKGNV